VREALFNVRRHAEAKRVSIAIERDKGFLRLLISDDGVGFDRDSAGASSFGLLGMEERIGSLGGELQVASSPGTGTRIEAMLPWKSRAMAPAA
jgi:signal transduction histidine kinase